MTIAVAGLDSMLGELALAAGEGGLLACQFRSPSALAARLKAGPGNTETDRMLELAKAEITAYLAGELQDFTVPVSLDVSDFDRTVLTALRDTVGYGQTSTYGQLARDLGLPVSAARAVGRALAGNPVLLIVPCHRVIGASGTLTGYAGGLPRKRALLDLESEHVGTTMRLFS
jgi:methylated-DNA-[protein]-cysteine S-methyltransferase